MIRILGIAATFAALVPAIALAQPSYAGKTVTLVRGGDVKQIEMPRSTR